ncbi:protoporphyrinogen/coproporphyrinogen oxidase [Clostridium beijerinckii]|uniref:protoporphyrinogen/coproporphyrinogen oxidase n=1 Tax=Clostridium beijerinckii TaxID=1520 RepID=UPI00047C0C42|nr:NAD(P)-binding protein [Clostridium beijerinckii]
MNNYVILGGGVAGIACGYFLGRESCTIYEKDEDYGGLCGSRKINDFTFDEGLHLSFAKSSEVRDIFDKPSHFTYNPEPYNYYKGLWIKHPIQNNLYKLPTDEKVKCIKSFLERENSKEDYNNYEEWLYTQYGKYIADKFPKLYTKKYWCDDARNLETKWIQNRMYSPSIDEILKGAMSDNTNDVYYVKEMRYPVRGGHKSFLEPMAKNLDIKLDKKVILIDGKHNYVEFYDGSKVYYENLISSIPLPELIKVLKDVPNEIINASKKLIATSMKTVSVGFNRPNVSDKLWFYIYDENILPARAHSPNLKSSNNAPYGCSSMQFEIYESPYKKIDMTDSNLCEHIKKSMVNMKIADNNDILFIDVKDVQYANIVFYKDIYKNREIVHKYLEKVGIHYIGRFGEWDYLWSDQSFLSGMNMAFKLKNIYK